MNYIGSKAKLNNWIFQYVDELIKPDDVFLDACSGSGTVSRHAAQKYYVISNDNMFFPSCIANGSIGTEDLIDEANKHIKEINNLNPFEFGIFYNEYSPKGGRMYFNEANAIAIDTCRLYLEGITNPRLKNLLIYCGLEALSLVSNTTGTCAAYLKHYQQRATKNFDLKIKNIVPGAVTTFTSDILDLLKSDLHYDLIYLDPPYNHRKYAPNYHLYETFALYDAPEIMGKTGLRANWKKESPSAFCSLKTAAKFFNDVFAACKAPLLVSYSSDGLLKLTDLIDLLKSNNYKVDVQTHEQKRYKADSSDNRVYREDELLEYLLIGTKTPK